MSFQLRPDITNYNNVTGEKGVIGDNEFDEANKNIPK
jgi:hypothetical protein